MSPYEIELLPSERALYALRSLYLRFGYRRYKVSKFEEYDLYAKNKSFLADSSVLTFTDTDGRLMALKPDITMSVIKNTKDSNTMQKVFYNESVYRCSESGFYELTQTGLECIGDIDDICSQEVIRLAYSSLETVDSHFLLDLSHMGFVTGLIGQITSDPATRAELLHALEKKSAHDISGICEKSGADDGCTQALVKLCSLYGKADDTIALARGLVQNKDMSDSLDSLEKIVNDMARCGMSDRLCIDFSLVNDTNYYNDIIFKGYIDGISSSVLSGGRYDSLVHKMGKNGGAIGFAVYLDSLDRLFASAPFGVDVWIKYDSLSDSALITAKAQELTQQGKSVRVQSRQGDFDYKEILDLSGGERDVR